MSTSRLDNNDDWTFGQSLAGYITGSKEIAQNVVTRLRSFKNDWFMDVEAEIDWFGILGSLNNESTIIREVSRVVSETTGVNSLDSLEVITNRDKRTANIVLVYTDIYKTTNTITEDFTL